MDDVVSARMDATTRCGALIYSHRAPGHRFRYSLLYTGQEGDCEEEPHRCEVVVEQEQQKRQQKQHQLLVVGLLFALC